MIESNEIAYQALSTDDEKIECAQVSKDCHQHRPARHRWLYFSLSHLALITLYTTLFIFVFRRLTDEPLPRRDAFPGLDVNYKLSKYARFNSSFAGKPGPESEEAWHELMDTMAIRVTAEELAVHDQQSVALPRGGYLAWLGVFHELHCVKVLRRWAWRDYYSELQNLSAFEMKHHLAHVDHCLEVLRSAALCRADTEVLTVFTWSEESPKPVFDPRRIDHRCVDWDHLMASSYVDRVVTHGELDELANPLFNQDKMRDG
ncbi:hypothetical protein AAL_03422 [Moelleriella libera RCEF 2490]|uniref:Tat pathway signal sequence n=1 Tax=Moelleriella libera RCEF 2490 TaxID=1081109 RepID=A0A168D7V8_9HYPO|nr:hypothetical protein AAL_03422 [Moelleriella libera RCEF 2490]